MKKRSISNCCDGLKEDSEFFERKEISKLSRKAFLKKVSSFLPVLLSGKMLHASSNEKIKLAFCGQLLCVVPYEVTRYYGFFEAQGLDVELIYTRGGGNAVRSLIGDSVDYAASSFDAALSAFSKGAPISRFMTTGILPLFALTTSPKSRSIIRSILDLEGKTVGISKLGNSDHALLLYLITKSGGDVKKVRFATLGTNLYEALLQEHIQAGMVQEPALTLINEKGGKTLVNFMDKKDSFKLLGGNYEFMGVAVLNDKVKQKKSQMVKLANALEAGLNATRTMPVKKLVDALPKSLIAGGDRRIFEKVLENNRMSLYPEMINIDFKACERVVKAHILAGRLKQGFNVSPLLRQDII